MTHCPGCNGNVFTVEYVDGLAVAGGSHTCPGVTCAACAECGAATGATAALDASYTCASCVKQKDAEIAALTDLIGINREQLVEIARLSALVDVGREMATVAVASKVSVRTRLLTIITQAEKWRSLEGKR